MDISHWYSLIKHAKMAIPIWYAILPATALGTWLVFRFISWIIQAILAFLTFKFLKHLLYPHLSRTFPIFGTRYQIFIFSIYIAINVACMTIGKGADISARSATMSLINLIPLLCGPRLVMMTKFLGITLRTQHLSHSWFGLTALAQILVHSVLSATQNLPFRWTKVNVSGVVGSSALGFLLVLSLRIFRRLVYEWFLRSHFVLTVAALVAIFIHISSKKPVGRVFLAIGVLLWTAVTVLHGVAFAFRNFACGRSLAVARVSRIPHALHVSIKVPQPWNVRAGEYVFLSIPAAGIASTLTLQSHPFMIAWWERSADGLTVYLLVKPRRGFTNKLAAPGLSDKDLMAFIDGPYGIDYAFGRYGTVLMFASGIGIAGQLPHIKELVAGYNNCTVCTQRIKLIWRLDKESHQQWVRKWMDAALARDTGRILDIDLYILERSSPKKASAEEDDLWAWDELEDEKAIQHKASEEEDGLRARYKYEDKKIVPHGTHKKLHQLFGQPNIRSILKRELTARKGSMIVSVCASSALAAEIRNRVRRDMNKDVRLVELDFEPSLRTSRKEGGKEDVIDMDFLCRGDV